VIYFFLLTLRKATTMTTADVERFLGALSTTTVGETSFYIYKDTNNEGKTSLVEKSFADGMMSLKTYIGAAPKSDSVVVLADEKGRSVIYVNDDNTLQDYRYSEIDGEWDWDAGDIGRLKVATHPDSKLTAIYKGGRRLLYFQSPSGDLTEIQYLNSSWSTPVVLPGAKPSPGTGLSAIATPDGVRIFYHHPSNSIHQAAFEGGSWKDNPLPNTSNASPNSRILTIGFGDQYIVYFQASDNTLQSLRHLNNEQDTLTALGTMGPEGFKPHSAKQFADMIFQAGSWPDFNTTCLVM